MHGSSVGGALGAWMHMRIIMHTGIGQRGTVRVERGCVRLESRHVAAREVDCRVGLFPRRRLPLLEGLRAHACERVASSEPHAAFLLAKRLPWLCTRPWLMATVVLLSRQLPWRSMTRMLWSR